MSTVRSKGHAAAKIVKRSANKPQGKPMKYGLTLVNPVDSDIPGYAYENLKHGPHAMVGPAGIFEGQVLALCGAGPSLATETIHTADQIWACNSAVGYLHDKVDLTAAIGIDQTEGMLKDWADPPPIRHYVASTCSPALIEHLMAHDTELVWFHNYTGFEGEIEHYNEDWPPAFMLATGATVVARVINMAFWLGFRRIDVYGADCAFGDGDLAHANGETLEDAYTKNTVVMEGEIGGRKWRSRPDMLMAAVDLVRKTRDSGGRIRLMGDTLPVSLLGADEETLQSVMRRLDPGEVPT